MIIKIQLPITTAFVEANTDKYIFLYSDTFQEPSCFGQSGVCNFITHKNCFRIPVRWSLCKSSGYFQDNQLEEVKKAIDKCIQKIPTEDTTRLIIPFPRMGCGASRMKELAPKAYEYMMQEVKKISYPFIEYIPAPGNTQMGVIAIDINIG